MPPQGGLGCRLIAEIAMRLPADSLIQRATAGTGPHKCEGDAFGQMSQFRSSTLASRAVIVVPNDPYDREQVAFRDALDLFLLDGLLDKQSVVSVLTGDESELSAPVSFEDL